jgi:hypothetical protein
MAISHPELPNSPTPPEPPELFRWIPWFGHHLQREWPLIRATPYTTGLVAITSAVFVGVGIFFYQEHHYSERFATFEATERYLSRQLEDYKQAFPGKSPDEAAKELVDLRNALGATKKRLDALEAMTQTISDRHLTDRQKSVLVQEIKRLKSWQLPRIMVASVQDPEADQYATEFIRLFKDNDISVEETYADPPDNTLLMPFPVREMGRAIGISISVRYPDNPPESAKLFYMAMWHAELWPTFEKFYGEFPNEFMLTIRYKN